eukprot:GHVS01081524.1.p1 GENE.GHVS01081524.1~~GHVS01081524.1.p1  ORF type:complete len:400 (+),score=82.10 GHVS01081524.1:220-1419(+)
MLLLGEASFSTPQQYETLASSASVYDAEIGRDIGRTYPDIELFRGKLSAGQRKLGRLLRACSLQLKDVGYCQGMNFIAATLLLLFDEPTAFECMLALLHRYSMKELYLPKLPKLQVAVYQLDRLVESFLPKVYDRLVSFNIQADFYSINWFMTLFSYDMTWPAVLKIWDQFLLKGWKVVFKVGLAMLYKIQNRLLSMQFDEALKFLKVFPKDEKLGAFCVDELLASSEQFAVTTRMLEALELAYSNNLDALVICLRDLDNNTVAWEVKTMSRREGPLDSRGSSTDTNLTQPTGHLPPSPPPTRRHRPAGPTEGDGTTTDQLTASTTGGGGAGRLGTTTAAAGGGRVGSSAGSQPGRGSSLTPSSGRWSPWAPGTLLTYRISSPHFGDPLKQTQGEEDLW